MPKVISVGGAWHSASIPGADLGDENLAFLGTFEEFLPQECTTAKVNKRGEVIKSQPKKRKQKKFPEISETDGEAALKKAKVVAKDSKEKNTVVKGPKQKKRTAKEETKSVEGVSIEEKGEDKKEAECKRKKKKNKKRLKQKGNQEDDSSVGNKEEQEGIEENESGVEEEKEVDMEEAKEEVDISAWTEFYLPQLILDNIRSLGFASPTEIQRAVLPSAVRDRLDVLGAAETGSGKTLAFVIPLVARLLEEERKGAGPRGLILAPTRELVVQVRKHVDAMLKGTPFRAASIVGGLSLQKQERIMKHRPDIVVASPGRLHALMKDAPRGSYLADLSGLCCLVIDETDRMAEKGHFAELEHIVAAANKASPSLQTLVFSATLTFCHLPSRSGMETQTMKEKLQRLVEVTKLRKQRKIFDLSTAGGVASTLVESRLNCDGLHSKDTSLVYLLRRYSGRSLIFCNSVDATRRLHGILSKLRISPLLLHAKMLQRQRLKNLERFAEIPDSVLLATDVAARGLDIKGIDHVFHYQVPKTAEIYIHRSGRTGRASARGLSILLVDPSEARFYRRICANLNRSDDLPVFPVDCESLFNALSEQVKIASELDSVEHRLRKKSQRESWFVNAAREADIDLDERENESSATKGEMARLAREEKALNGSLRALLATGLPQVDRANLPQTRYVNRELVARFDGKATKEAMKSVEVSMKEAAEKKKRARLLLSSQHLRIRKGKAK